MSDLPKSVGQPHRAAQRNVNQRNTARERNQPVRPGMMGQRAVSGPPAPVVSEPGNDAPGRLKAVDVVAFNQAAELGAIAYLSRYIQEHGAPSYNTACSLIALEMDVSTETAKRYLRKYSVDHPKAKFKIENGMVYTRASDAGAG
jgi:hypothetical protein